MDNARRDQALSYRFSTLAAAKGADLVLHLTECNGPGNLGEVVAARQIVGGRHALDPVTWRASGWTYRAPDTSITSRRAGRDGATAASGRQPPVE